MDIYRLGSTIKEPTHEPGYQYTTAILINPGDEVYLYIVKVVVTKDDLQKYRRDIYNICRYLNYQQRVQEELFDKNGC